MLVLKYSVHTNVTCLNQSCDAPIIAQKKTHLSSLSYLISHLCFHNLKHQAAQISLDLFAL